MAVKSITPILLCAVLSFSGLAQAKTNQEQAKVAYIEAQKLFQAEEYELALPLFQQAYELSGRRATAVMGLAQCERVLKMYAESIGHFSEYLTKTTDANVKERISATLVILKKQHKKALKEEEEARKKEEERKKEAQILRDKDTELLALKLAEKLVTNESKKETTSPIWSNPWLWVGIGVVVAGSAVGLGFALTPQDDIYPGSSDRIITP